VRRWRNRWLAKAAWLQTIEAEGDEKEIGQSITEALADEARSGSPGKFTTEEVCQIMAVACELPAESNRPVTNWTGKELADEVIKRGIVASISARQVGRYLERAKTTPVSILAED